MGMIVHMIAFGIGFVLDLIFGDPYWLPHPIRLIGGCVGKVEMAWNQADLSERQKLRRGGAMVLLVLIGTLAVSAGILILAYELHLYVGIAVEAVMTYQILATKCLKVESMKVYAALKKPDLTGARKAVAMIVGRDTQKLDEVGVAKAAIETVAENTSDGVIAPMLCLAIGGPVLGFGYKAVNTMDSMVGYKNERYFYFGKVAAKLDDVANFLPSRISAAIMIGVSFLLGAVPFHGADGKPLYNGFRAIRIYGRDRRKHASPNSAQTEAVCAGALGIQLAGDASYFGRVVHKPWIGDAVRPVETEDIRRANVLLYGTAWVCEVLCLVIMLIVSLIW